MVKSQNFQRNYQIYLQSLRSSALIIVGKTQNGSWWQGISPFGLHQNNCLCLLPYSIPYSHNWIIPIWDLWPRGCLFLLSRLLLSKSDPISPHVSLHLSIPIPNLPFVSPKFNENRALLHSIQPPNLSSLLYFWSPCLLCFTLFKLCSPNAMFEWGDQCCHRVGHEWPEATRNSRRPWWQGMEPGMGSGH